jgi:hypothetical protein
MTVDVPTPNVPGDDGFNVIEERLYKGYFCKFVCQKEWDDFHDEQVFMNDEFIKNARAVFNEQSLQGFLDALLEDNSKYLLFARRMLDALIRRDLFVKEENNPQLGTTYWRTDKLKDLCPTVLQFQFPVIDSLVDVYDKQHESKK